jgi:hypothetical protein
MKVYVLQDTEKDVGEVLSVDETLELAMRIAEGQTDKSLTWLHTLDESTKHVWHAAGFMISTFNT